MKKKIGPYIGVTGFMSRAEVLEAFKVIPKESERRLMVGVLMSSATLNGQLGKWPGRYPKKENVEDIFINSPRVLNLIHYSTAYSGSLHEQLEEITKLAGPYLDGFQLNIPWPPVEEIRKYHEAHREKFLVLQIGKSAIAAVISAIEPDGVITQESMERINERIGRYLPMIDAVLFDMSGGRGNLLDAEHGVAYLRLARSYPGLGLGIAGGLDGRTLHVLDPLIKAFPSINIDAEGELRTRVPEDRLSLDAVNKYLQDAFPILAGKELPGMYLIKGSSPYGFEKHVHCCENGINMLRTPRLAQPHALEVGDRLATGDCVLSPPRQGGNGVVWIHLTGGFNGHWIDVPARIPIALLTKEDNAPESMWDR